MADFEVPSGFQLRRDAGLIEEEGEPLDRTRRTAGAASMQPGAEAVQRDGVHQSGSAAAPRRASSRSEMNAPTCRRWRSRSNRGASPGTELCLIASSDAVSDSMSLARPA